MARAKKILRITVPCPGESDPNRLLIDSTAYQLMQYEIIDGSLVVYTPQNGVLAVSLRGLREWAQELAAMADVWEGVRT